MSKKVIYNPSDSSCAVNRKVCCSICESPSKSIFYLCKSGRHVICVNCQRSGFINNNRNDDGDYVPEKECATIGQKEISYISHSGLNPRDLSSGDHSRIVEADKNNLYCNDDMTKSINPTSTPKGRCSKCKPTTVVIYRNEKFYDNNRSSITSNHIGHDSTIEPNYESISRPVVCPVTSCSKIVTIESFSQHFNFDHSKLPRLLLNSSEPQEVLFNCSILNEETKCIATFVISLEKGSSTSLRRIESHTNIHNLNNKECQFLLLMVAKISIEPTNTSNTKRTSKESMSKSYTLLEDKRGKNEQINILCTNKSVPKNQICCNNNKDDNDLILLWLCRLNDKHGIYSISVSREDKQQGYSYIGEAIHIRNEQDPISIYGKTECLSVRKVAINKLVTAKNELKVIINTVQ